MSERGDLVTENQIKSAISSSQRVAHKALELHMYVIIGLGSQIVICISVVIIQISGKNILQQCLSKVAQNCF